MLRDFNHVRLCPKPGSVDAVTSEGVIGNLGSRGTMEVQNNRNAGIFEHCTPLTLEGDIT